MSGLEVLLALCAWSLLRTYLPKVLRTVSMARPWARLENWTWLQALRMAARREQWLP